MSKAYDVLRESVEDAVKLWAQVLRDPYASTADRLKASQLIVERVMGKAPERVHLDFGTGGQEPPWLKALAGAVQVIDANSHEIGNDDFIHEE